MDHHGVPRRRVSPRSDEGGQFRGDAHRRDTQGGAARAGLPALGAQAAQGHQGRECAAQRDGGCQTGGFW